jgi:hypothetical protein
MSRSLKHRAEAAGIGRILAPWLGMGVLKKSETSPVLLKIQAD